MPTISVIIPTYNNQNTILETIESIQKQSYSDLEILVINDGSTDKTLEVLKTVTDERLKIFSYENGGVSVARNRGISLAKGKYIAFIDADDLWTVDKLELQLMALQKNPKAGLAYSWTLIMNENGEQFHSCEPVLFEGNVYAQLLTRNFLISPSSNILVSQKALKSVGEFDPNLRYSEDWDLCLRLARNWDFVVVPKYQIFYRQSLASASSNIEAFEKSKLAIIERAFENAPKEIQLLKPKTIANAHLYWAQLNLSRVKGIQGAKQARNQLIKAIRLYPKIFLSKNFHILVIKIFIIQVLSPNVADYLFKLISKMHATKMK